MKKSVLFFAACMTVLGLSSCDQGTYNSSGLFGQKTVKASKTYVTKDIRVDNFTKVDMAGSFDVTYTQKPGRPTVEVYTSDNIVNLLDIYVKGGTLHLGFKKNVRVSFNKLQVRISSEQLDNISLAGSGSFLLPGELKTGNLKLSVTGSGDIKVNRAVCAALQTTVTGSGYIDCKDMVCASMQGNIIGSGDVTLEHLLASSSAEAEVTGSGTFKINGGKAREAAYNITGSGDIHAASLEASRVNTHISGSGNIECHAVDFLKVRVSGSGNVGYKGDPELDVPKRHHHRL